MGLFDTVAGALGGAAGAGSGGPSTDLTALVSALLSQDGGGGGLRKLVATFQEAGFGNVVASWVGTGENLPISAAQISQVLGSDMMTGFAQKLGMSSGDLASQLSQMLPQVVDRLTPGGQVPAGGADGFGDITGLLGALLRR